MWFMIAVIVMIFLIAAFGESHDMAECLADGHKRYECRAMFRGRR